MLFATRKRKIRRPSGWKSAMTATPTTNSSAKSSRRITNPHGSPASPVTASRSTAAPWSHTHSPRGTQVRNTTIARAATSFAAAGKRCTGELMRL